MRCDNGSTSNAISAQICKPLEQTINYLQENWTDKELRILASKLEDTLNLISQNPKLFQVIEATNKIRSLLF